MPLLQGVVDGRDAHHLADAALHRRMQAEQADELGRRLVVGIVVVEAQVDVGDGRPDARAGLELRAGVHHVVEHLAVQLLRHRPGKQARQQPVEVDRFLARDLVHRQAVEHGEHRPALRHAPDLGHRGAAGVEGEIPGIEQEGRHRGAAQLVPYGQQLAHGGVGEGHRPVGRRDRRARPGSAERARGRRSHAGHPTRSA